jgi:hypothetical protein
MQNSHWAWELHPNGKNAQIFLIYAKNLHKIIQQICNVPSENCQKNCAIDVYMYAGIYLQQALIINTKYVYYFTVPISTWIVNVSKWFLHIYIKGPAIQITTSWLWMSDLAIRLIGRYIVPIFH